MSRSSSDTEKKSSRNLFAFVADEKGDGGVGSQQPQERLAFAFAFVLAEDLVAPHIPYMHYPTRASPCLRGRHVGGWRFVFPLYTFDTIPMSLPKDQICILGQTKANFRGGDEKKKTKKKKQKGGLYSRGWCWCWRCWEGRNRNIIANAKLV